MHHQSAILHMTENMQWEENLMMQSGMQAVLSPIPEYSWVQLTSTQGWSSLNTISTAQPELSTETVTCLNDPPNLLLFMNIHSDSEEPFLYDMLSCRKIGQIQKWTLYTSRITKTKYTGTVSKKSNFLKLHEVQRAAGSHFSCKLLAEILGLGRGTKHS